ncbi:hypothetical protein LNV09_03260 [Paucibacter sp. B2R-40]|uniref:hypothetical protein n=1 Tax=Paucibacter sp. B2R-40 TaxID=2893554 RepID=UPI0021E4244A|nr:hypothetical protein [Paucibacter sp. B2R-40]MCV2353174.1 hypothetical protein [Paucibacter sp. B2R-40]
MTIHNQATSPLALSRLKQQFDEAWWDDFMRKTHNMTVPATITDGLTAEQARLMRRLVLDILAEVCQVHRRRYGYRLWMDGEPVETLAEHFAHHPKPGEDVQAWVRRAFGDHKFGIILNQGEKFSAELSQAAAIILKPILEMIGMPTEGILFTVFIGNYEMTPLGIHKDFAGKSGVHFHLGPGPKTMYTWEDEDYKTAPVERRQNNMNVAAHLPTATKHTFHEGQFYFMPENKFHVGMQDELSIGIACWFNNRCDYDFVEELLKHVMTDHVRRSEGMLKADRNPVDDTTTVDAVLSLLTLEDKEDLALKPLLRGIYRDFRYCLFSNAGFRNRPVPNPVDIDIEPGDAVRIDEPYRLLYRTGAQPGRHDVFVRGTRVSLQNFAGLDCVVDLLNSGTMVTVAQLAALLDDARAERKVCHLLKVLHKYRGITVVTESVRDAAVVPGRERERSATV